MDYWSLEQAKLGAQIAVLDRDAATAAEVAAAIPNAIRPGCDLTDRHSVDAAMDAVVSRFVGLDILVSNARAATGGWIADLDDATQPAGSGSSRSACRSTSATAPA